MGEVFLHLARMGLYADLLVLAVLVLRGLLQRAPKRIVCLLWALVALRLVCPAQISWRASLMPPTEAVTQTVQQMPALVLPGQEAPAAARVPQQASAPDAAQDWTSVLGRAWFAGMIGMLAWAAWSDLRLRRRLCASVRVQDNVWLCDGIDTPFVRGLFAPRIYLPSGGDAAQNVYILAHERAHIARGDHWWKLLGWFLLSVYWFHPPLWLAYVLFCRDLELACDERAIRGLDRAGRAAYSRALVDCSSAGRSALVFPVAFGEVGVKSRVKAVLSGRKPARWLVVIAVLAVAAAAVFFLTTRPAEGFDDYFAQYRAAVLDGDAQAAAVRCWFENETRRQMYLDSFQQPESFTVTEQTQINDDLWVFACEEQLPEMPPDLIYQFVGRSGGRLWLYRNVSQIPEAISDGLDRSLYDYHEDENVMNADEDEQIKALEQADAKALIEAYPNTDGAYTDLLLTKLAEYYLSDPEGVSALIEQYTLTEQQKKELLTGIENAFASLDDSSRIYAMRADASGVIEVSDYGVVLTLPEGWAEQTVAVCDRSEDSIWVYLANERLMNAYEDDPAFQGQGWRDYILFVYAEKKWAHPEPPDYALSGMTPVLIGETDSVRVYASSERDVGHDTFLNLRDQFIQKIGQARYDALVGDLAADPNQIREYVHLRQP